MGGMPFARSASMLKTPNDKDTNMMVRFLCAYRDFVKLSDEFGRRKTPLGTELQRLCEGRNMASEIVPIPILQRRQTRFLGKVWCEKP